MMGRPAKYVIQPGETFARLTVIEDVGRYKHGGRLLRCRCICGNLVDAAAWILARGGIRSCGCLLQDFFKDGGARHVTHGESRDGNKSAEYTIWTGMIGRCCIPSSGSYYRYGATGIKVCERWMKYENFLADVGRRPSPDHSLDRVDSSLGYSPENVKWATREQQQNHTSANINMTYQGETKTLAQWCRHLGIRYSTVHSRVKRGWAHGRALSERINPYVSRT